jgi:hypothetical protein
MTELVYGLYDLKKDMIPVIPLGRFPWHLDKWGLARLKGLHA